LLIAIITKKLYFTTSEKYVDDFVNKLELSKEIKRVAANIVKSAWGLHKTKSNPLQYKFSFLSTNRISQNRSLLLNIQKIKDLRRRQRDLNSASINSVEIYRQCKASDLEVQKLCKITNNLEFQMSKVQTKMKIIEDKLDSIVHLLSEVKLKNDS